jgi:hypothetical protein
MEASTQETGLNCGQNYIVGNAPTHGLQLENRQFTGATVNITAVHTVTDDGTNHTNGAVVDPLWLDPNRSVASYWASIGSPGSFPITADNPDAWIDLVEATQMKGAENPALWADAINNNIRLGFNIAAPGGGGGITLGALPNGTVGTGYSGSAAASGGTGPYTYALTSGSLPPGLGPLNTSTGAVTGTPTTAGTYSFRITATDSVPASGFQDYVVTIAAAAGPPQVLMPQICM